MRNWPWRKIFFGIACFLVVLGVSPLAALMWHGYAHNFQPLSMQLPFQKGTYTSAVFKTDLDESYIVQLELMDATHRSVGLNSDAFLDLDWKIVDDHDAVIAQGTENVRLNRGNTVNFGQDRPKRGLRQRMIVDIHGDIAEPEGSRLTLEVNSTEDPEGMAFGFVLFLWWAGIVGGPGAVILLVLLMLHASRRAAAEKFPRIQETPRSAPPGRNRWPPNRRQLKRPTPCATRQCPVRC